MESVIKKNKLSFSILLAVILITIMPFVMSSLGTYKQHDCVQIKTILNSSWVNISTISYPNSSIAVSNLVMSKVGQTFNYTFCLTSSLGTYVYDFLDNHGDVYVNDFTITSTGNSSGNTLPIFLLLGAVIIFGLALYTKNEYFGFFAGAIFIVAGVYMMVYGLGSIWDMYTQTLSYISLGMGIILIIMSSYEAMSAGERVGGSED